MNTTNPFLRSLKHVVRQALPKIKATVQSHTFKVNVGTTVSITTTLGLEYYAQIKIDEASIKEISPEVHSKIEDYKKHGFEFLGFHGSRSEKLNFNPNRNKPFFFQNQDIETSIRYLYGGTGSLNLVFTKNKDDLGIKSNRNKHNYFNLNSQTSPLVKIETIPLQKNRLPFRAPFSYLTHQMSSEVQ